MKLREDYSCPLELVHDMLRGKWKTVILWQINYRKNPSLIQLEKDIKGITQKVLVEQLNELIHDKLVYKEKSSGYPLKVNYYLIKDRGEKVIEAIKIYQDLGILYLEEIGKKK